MKRGYKKFRKQNAILYQLYYNTTSHRTQQKIYSYAEKICFLKLCKLTKMNYVNECIIFIF